jgi:phosphatidylglycerol:prolipoprotein diacylglycerol transferase
MHSSVAEISSMLVQQRTILDSGSIWCVALLIALAYAVRSARRSGLDPRSMYWAVTCAILCGLWGANLLGVVVHGGSGAMALLNFWQGGKSWYGGALAGGLAGGLFFYFRKLPVLSYADASVPAVALGYSVGRLGCFLNGDDFGTLSHLPWAVAYPRGTEAYYDHLARGWITPAAPSSLPIHPVQLYASLFGLCLFVVLTSWRTRQVGDRLCAFLALYGAERFLMEKWFRGDFRPVLGPFSLPQVFSLLFVCAGVAIWVRAQRTAREEKGIVTSVEFVTGD